MGGPVRRPRGSLEWSGQPAPRHRGSRPSARPGPRHRQRRRSDTIWLAERGWPVTGIDFSTVALERAAKHAATAGVGEHTEWRHVDVRTFDPGPEGSGERWDLVMSQFMHPPDGAMVDLTRRLAAAVAPGGALLVVGQHPMTS